MGNTRLIELPWGVVEASRGMGAHIAVLLTRRALSRKSANKARVATVQIPDAPYAPGKNKLETIDRTIENARLLTEQIRNLGDSPQILGRLEQGVASWQDIQTYAARVKAARTGNCLEFAIVAFEKLAADGWRQLELVQLAAPSSHCFVVLGSARAPAEYPMGFAFGNDAVICDPWAHIACDVAAYEREWDARMQKWTRERTEIFVPNAQISPRDYTLQHRQRVMCSIQ
jgi:hypothetical protein